MVGEWKKRAMEGLAAMFSARPAARETAKSSEAEVEKLRAKIGQLLEPLPEAGSYLGFIFAKGARPEEAEAAVRTAYARLAFTVSAPIALSTP